MGKQLVSDELWAAVEPLLPKHLPRTKGTTGGRPRINDRAALTGILFVLRSGIPWEMLPQEMGCGSGMTCWRRLQEWHQAGVWEELQATLLDTLAQADQLDWSRACVDSASVAAPLAPKRVSKKGDIAMAKSRSAAKMEPATSGRIRRIAANRARNAILWSMPEERP